MQTAGSSPQVGHLNSNARTSIVAFAKSPKKFIKKPQILEQAGQVRWQSRRRQADKTTQPQGKDEDEDEGTFNKYNNKKQRLTDGWGTAQKRQLSIPRRRGYQSSTDTSKHLLGTEDETDNNQKETSVRVPKVDLWTKHVKASEATSQPLLDDVPTHELGVDSYDWQSAFLTTRMQRKQQVEQKRRRLFGRGWRQLDVRYYLLRRAKNAQAHAALLEQAPAQLKAARNQHLATTGEYTQSANTAISLNFSAGLRYQTGLVNRNHTMLQSQQDVKSIESEQRQLTDEAAESGTSSHAGTLAPIPKLKLPWRRGNGPLDDSLPKPATFFKLPIRWRKRILAERVVALRADLPSVSPAAAVHLYTHAPVMLCLTTRAVVAQIQGVARVLNVKHGRATRKIAGHPLLGLIDMDTLAITTASICYWYRLGYPHVVGALSNSALLLTSRADKIYNAVERLSQLMRVSERQVMTGLLKSPELISVALQPGLTAITQCIQQLQQEAFALETGNETDGFDNNWQSWLSQIGQSSQHHDTGFFTVDGLRQAHLQQLLHQHPSVFHCKPSKLQHVKHWLEHDLKLTPKQAAQAILLPGNATLLAALPEQSMASATTFCSTLQRVLQVDNPTSPRTTPDNSIIEPLMEDTTAPSTLLTHMITQPCAALLQLSKAQIRACIGSVLRICQFAHSPSCLELLRAMPHNPLNHPQTEPTSHNTKSMSSTSSEHSQETDVHRLCQLLYNWSVTHPLLLLHLHEQRSTSNMSQGSAARLHAGSTTRARQQPTFGKHLTAALERAARLPDGRAITKPLWLKPHPTARSMTTELLRLPTAASKPTHLQQLKSNPALRPGSANDMTSTRSVQTAFLPAATMSTGKVLDDLLNRCLKDLQTACSFKTEAAALLLWLLRPRVMSYQGQNFNNLDASHLQPAGSFAAETRVAVAPQPDVLMLQRSDVHQIVKQLKETEQLVHRQFVEQPMVLSDNLDDTSFVATAIAHDVKRTSDANLAVLDSPLTKTRQVGFSQTSNGSETHQQVKEQDVRLPAVCDSHPIQEPHMATDVQQESESETRNTTEVQQQGIHQTNRPPRRSRGYIKQN